MRRMLVAVTLGLLLSAVMAEAAKPTPDPNDPKVFLVGKAVDYSESRSLPYRTPDKVAFENVLVNGDHYVIFMRFENNMVAASFEPISLLKLPTVHIAVVPNGAIEIDGYAIDWAGIEPAMTDPAGDLIFPEYYSSIPSTDLHELYIAHDDNNVYFRMTTHNPGPMPYGGYTVEFQQYLYQVHTPGDVAVTCVNHEGQGWAVYASDWSGYSAGNYPPGTGYCAPGYEGGWIEWKVPITNLQHRMQLGTYFPAGPIDRGIENRFVRWLMFPMGGPGPSDEYDRMNQKLIVDFYPD